MFIKIKEMDDNLAYLIGLLKQKGIFDEINIIIVSDHGMATMVPRGTVLVQNYTDTRLINSTRTVYGVTTNLYPIDGQVSSHQIRRLVCLI